VSATDHRTVEELLADSAGAGEELESAGRVGGEPVDGVAFHRRQEIRIGLDATPADGCGAIGRSVTAGHWPGTDRATNT
jgi:hypothetical protein